MSSKKRIPPMTEVMRWAIEQAILGKLDSVGAKYSEAARESVLANSCHLCEKTGGKEGVNPETLYAALRIACNKMEEIRIARIRCLPYAPNPRPGD